MWRICPTAPRSRLPHLTGGRCSCTRAGCTTRGRSGNCRPAAPRCCSTSAAGSSVPMPPLAGATAPFAEDTACLMDFRTPQPAHGLSFGYLLPLGPDRALVEYTEFSAAPLSRASYDAALEHYTTQVLGLGPFEVWDTEQGVIPMTDARFPRQTGRHTFRIGTSGGATRPATGYTFASVQRQSLAIATAYRRGALPAPPQAHSRRSLALDAVMLRALDSGRVAGADFFTRLFEHVPMERMLRFLDGRTSVREDLTIGFATPVLPMLRTVAEMPFLRRGAS
ncbi:lycopene cyclase family protein [Streptomyces sp. CS131]|uniref:lycopene cyclase family protein n=1 Tax=Streptomyces sp. CS131 TaxID=2162711 RepID=UPI001EF44BFB|nr:lycopene cyclase family protein [Streptomyces sp. CS131]